MTIEQGAQAPDFAAEDDSGATVKLSDFKGRPVVVYFYPKDNTPGCTTEACDFRDLQPDFGGVDAAVLGVSKDSVKSHAGFKAKQDLNFPLISDPDGAICEAFGVWQEKKNYGKTYMGIVRSTFLIDKDGTVAKVWSPVKVKGHAQAVLDAAKAL